MNTEFVGLFAVDLFLRDAVVESSVVEAPVAETVPLTAGLSVELQTIILRRVSTNSSPSQIYALTYVHILLKLIDLMLQDSSKIFAGIVHLLQRPIQSHPRPSRNQLRSFNCSLRRKMIERPQLVIWPPEAPS